MRARLLVVTLVLLVMASAPAAQAGSTRRLCAPSAILRDSPKGFVIAHLYRPQRLGYIRRSADRRWALVRTRTGLAGWIRYRKLCRG